MADDITIDDYISAQPDCVQETLRALYAAIKKELPNATEKISWGMPTFVMSKNIIHFAAHKNHIGLYPGPAAVEAYTDDLSEYKHSKGAFQFRYNQPLPLATVKSIIEFNLSRA